MVEEATIFVVGHQEDGLGPLPRICREVVDDGGKREFTQKRR